MPARGETESDESLRIFGRIVTAESHSAIYQFVRALRWGNLLCVAGAPAS